MGQGREILIALYIKHKGNWNKIYNDIYNKAMVDFKIINAGIDLNDYVTILDDDYPEELKHIYKPPFVYERATGYKPRWSDIG